MEQHFNTQSINCQVSNRMVRYTDDQSQVPTQVRFGLSEVADGFTCHISVNVYVDMMLSCHIIG